MSPKWPKMGPNGSNWLSIGSIGTKPNQAQPRPKPRSPGQGLDLWSCCLTNCMFLLIWQVIFFQHACIWWLSLAFHGQSLLTNQILHIYNLYQLFLYKNRDVYVLSKNIKYWFCMIKQTKRKTFYFVKNHDLILNFFLHAHLWLEITINHVFNTTIGKTLLVQFKIIIK